MTLNCIGAKRIENAPTGNYYKYLICNGSNMGRETIKFGVNCIADTDDCKGFVKNFIIMHKDKGYKIFNIKINAYKN